MIHCTFENNNSALLRHAVVDTLVIRGEEILLVKRTSKLLEGGKWALPGGYVEREETIYEAAEREILEETGWKVKDPYLLMVNSSPNRPKEDRQNIAFVLVYTATEKIGESDWESDEVKWFPIKGLTSKINLAFDHAEDVNLYLKSKEQPLKLPVVV
jgi:ADP-ribose pyrophosphatase YjhB (NUDIX family)